jgi:acyl dehydratase
VRACARQHPQTVARQAGSLSLDGHPLAGRQPQSGSLWQAGICKTTERQSMFFEDFGTKQTWEIPSFSLTKEEIIEFADRYDPMRFHLDEEYAAQTRFGGLIASGHQTFLAAWTSFSVANPNFQEGIVAGTEITERWLRPVYANDRLSGQLSVTKLVERNPHNGAVHFRAEISNQSGACVLVAQIEIIFRRKA